MDNTCLFHQDSPVTNLCLIKNCLAPLCPQCIQAHINQHMQNNEQILMNDIDDMYQQSLKAMNEVTNKFKYNLILMDNTKQTLRQRKEQGLKQMEEVRKHIISQINSYFDAIKVGYEQNTNNYIKVAEQQIDTISKLLQQKLEQSIQVTENLQGEKQLKTLIKLQKSSYLTESQDLNTDCKLFIDNINEKYINLYISNEKIYSIRQELADYCYVDTEPCYYQVAQFHQRPIVIEKDVAQRICKASNNELFAEHQQTLKQTAKQKEPQDKTSEAPGNTRSQILQDIQVILDDTLQKGEQKCQQQREENSKPKVIHSNAEEPLNKKVLKKQQSLKSSQMTINNQMYIE